MIETLIDKDHAYEAVRPTSGSQVASHEAYGSLSRRNRKGHDRGGPRRGRAL